MSGNNHGRDQMADQLLFEAGPDGEKAIHNLLMDGPGSQAIHQGKIPLQQFLDKLRFRYAAQEPQVFGLIPSGMTLRSIYQRHGMNVFLMEVPPGVRTLRWLRDDSPRPYGSGATYRDVTIALPYQYFFVAVTPQSELGAGQSVYFLNQPLTSLTERLGDCHYYNCSVDAYGFHCWICTQNINSQLPPRRDQTPLGQAALFLEWFFASSFNASSEYHEGQSFWGKNKRHLGDVRISSITQWVKETATNPGFILEVPWQPSLRPMDIFEQLTVQKSQCPGQLSDLIRVMRSR